MIIKLKYNSHYRFFCLLVLLVILLFIRYAFQFEIPRIVLTLIIAIIAICGDRDEIIAISMCCIPLHEAVDVYYSIVICTIIYVLKNFRQVRFNFNVILVYIMMIWEMLHCFYIDFSIMNFLVSMIPLIFLVVLMCIDVSTIDYGFVARILSIVIAIMSIILLVNSIVAANYNFVLAFSNLRRLGMILDDNSIVGGTINPNSLGVLCVLGLTSLLQLRAIGKNIKSDVILILILLLFGTLTTSRTFLVCLILMAFLFVIGQKGSVNKKIKLILSLIMLTVVALVLLNFLFPELMEYYMKRFMVKDITTGRSELMRVYHDFYSDNLEVMLFGVGLNNYEEKLLITYQVTNNVPHNSIQEIIVAWGIPGLVMFVLLFVIMITKGRKYNRQTLLNYIPLIIILTKSMAGQLLRSNYSMLALSFAYLSLCQNFSQPDLRHEDTRV